jgi:hypothetical protein
MNMILKELLLSMPMDLPWLIQGHLSQGTKTYVLPSQCEQVFYSEVPGKVGWSYIVRYDPRGRPVKYNVPEEDDIEEEEDAEEHEVDVPSDEEVEEVEPDVDDNVLDDDIDDDIIENDI